MLAWCHDKVVAGCGGEPDCCGSECIAPRHEGDVFGVGKEVLCGWWDDIVHFHPQDGLLAFCTECFPEM